MRYTLQRAVRNGKPYAFRWDAGAITGTFGPVSDDGVLIICQHPAFMATLAYDTSSVKSLQRERWETPLRAYDDESGELPAHPIYRQLFTGNLETMQTVQRAIDAAMPHVSPLDCVVLLTRDPSMAGWTIVGQPPTATAMARVERAAFDIAERTSV